ncbi:MAG: NRDE family protein [Cellvibrionaceae bacterium]
MCLILFSINSHPQLPLVIAANRDEFYRRPTLAASFWDDQPMMLAGKDLEAGGTWMGITRKGRFAALTNFRSPNSKNPKNLLSRGELVRDFLSQEKNNPISAISFAEKAINDGSHYAGFNLLIKDDNDFVYCNNQTNETQILSPGTYALSNHLLNTPWPKVITGRTELRDRINNTSKKMTEEKTARLANSLFEILQNKAQAPETKLPRTGIDENMERLLSSLFIESEHYGTCSSTTIIFNKDNNVYFHEKNYYTDKHRKAHQKSGVDFFNRSPPKNKDDGQYLTDSSGDNIFNFTLE